jgi:hypothetical protein
MSLLPGSGSGIPTTSKKHLMPRAFGTSTRRRKTLVFIVEDGSKFFRQSLIGRLGFKHSLCKKVSTY